MKDKVMNHSSIIVVMIKQKKKQTHSDNYKPKKPRKRMKKTMLIKSKRSKVLKDKNHEVITRYI